VTVLEAKALDPGAHVRLASAPLAGVVDHHTMTGVMVKFEGSDELRLIEYLDADVIEVATDFRP